MICTNPAYENVTPLIEDADKSSQGSCNDPPTSPSRFLQLEVGDVDSITSSQLRSSGYRSAKSASFSPMLRERSSSCPLADTPGTTSSQKLDWCVARLPKLMSPLSHTSLSTKQIYGSPNLTRSVREIVAYSPTGSAASPIRDLPPARSYPPATPEQQETPPHHTPDHSDTIGVQPTLAGQSLQADSPSPGDNVSSDRPGSSGDSCPAIKCSPLPFIRPPTGSSVPWRSPMASPLSGLSGPSASWDLAESAPSPDTLGLLDAMRKACYSRVLIAGRFVPGTSGVTPQEYIAAAAAELGIRSSLRTPNGASPTPKPSSAALGLKPPPTAPPISPWTSVASEWNMSTVSPMLSVNRSAESLAKSPGSALTPSPRPHNTPSSCDTPQEPLRRRYATVELSPAEVDVDDVRGLRKSLRERYSLHVEDEHSHCSLEREVTVMQEAERRLSQEALQSHCSGSLSAAVVDKWLAVAGTPKGLAAASPCGTHKRAPSLQLPSTVESSSSTATTSVSPSPSPFQSPPPLKPNPGLQKPPGAETSSSTVTTSISPSVTHPFQSPPPQKPTSPPPVTHSQNHGRDAGATSSSSSHTASETHPPGPVSPQVHVTATPYSLVSCTSFSPTTVSGKASSDKPDDAAASSDDESVQHMAAPINVSDSVSPSPASSSSLKLPIPISPEILAEVTSSQCSPASRKWRDATGIAEPTSDSSVCEPTFRNSLESHRLRAHRDCSPLRKGACTPRGLVQLKEKPTIDSLCLQAHGSPGAVLGTLAKHCSPDSDASSVQRAEMRLRRPPGPSKVPALQLSFLPGLSNSNPASPTDTHDVLNSAGKVENALADDSVHNSPSGTSKPAEVASDTLRLPCSTARFLLPADEESEASSMAVPASARVGGPPALHASHSAAFPAEEASETSCGRLNTARSQRVPKLRLPARRAPAVSAPTAIRSSLSHSAHNSARGEAHQQPQDTSPPPPPRGSIADKAKSLPTGMRHACVPGLQLAAVRSLPSGLQSGQSFDLLTPRDLVRRWSPRLMTPPDTLASAIVGTGVLMASPATVRSSQPFLSPRDDILEGLVTPRDVAEATEGPQGTPSSVIATGIVASPVQLTTTMLMGTMRSEWSCRSSRSLSGQLFTHCTGVLASGKLLTPSVAPPTPPPLPRRVFARPPRTPPRPVLQVATPSSDDTQDRTLQAIIAGVCGASSSFRSSPSPNMPTCCFATTTAESFQMAPSPMISSPPSSPGDPSATPLGTSTCIATPQICHDPFPMTPTAIESEQMSASPQAVRQSAAQVRFFHWKSIEEDDTPGPRLVEDSARRSLSSHRSSSPQDNHPEASQSTPTPSMHPPSQPQSACGMSTLSLRGSYCSAYRETWQDAMAALAIAKREAAESQPPVCTPNSTHSTFAKRLCIQPLDDSTSEGGGPSVGEPSPLTSAHGFARTLPRWSPSPSTVSPNCAAHTLPLWSPNPSTISTNANARMLSLWKSPDQSVITAPGTLHDTITSSNCDARTLPSPNPLPPPSPESQASTAPLLHPPSHAGAPQPPDINCAVVKGEKTSKPATSRLLAFSRRLLPITTEVAGGGPVGLEPSPLSSTNGFARTLPPWSPCASTTRNEGSLSLAAGTPVATPALSVMGPLRDVSTGSPSGTFSGRDTPTTVTEHKQRVSTESWSGPVGGRSKRAPTVATGPTRVVSAGSLSGPVELGAASPESPGSPQSTKKPSRLSRLKSKIKSKVQKLLPGHRRKAKRERAGV